MYGDWDEKEIQCHDTYFVYRDYYPQYGGGDGWSGLSAARVIVCSSLSTHTTRPTAMAEAEATSVSTTEEPKSSSEPSSAADKEADPSAYYWNSYAHFGIHEVRLYRGGSESESESETARRDEGELLHSTWC